MDIWSLTGIFDRLVGGGLVIGGMSSGIHLLQLQILVEMVGGAD
jgi:hypothetical protein